MNDKERLKYSFNSFFGNYKDKSIEELRELFVDKYSKKYDELESDFVERLKELREREHKLMVKESELANYLKVDLDKYFESTKFKDIEKWLFDANCKNPDFNRGYIACANAIKEIMRAY